MKRTIVVLALSLVAAPLFAAESPADAGKAPPVKDAHADCLKETGSRVKPKDGKCIEAPGQVLTREDLDRTGSVDTADAIRKLAPAAR